MKKLFMSLMSIFIMFLFSGCMDNNRNKNFDSDTNLREYSLYAPLTYLTVSLPEYIEINTTPVEGNIQELKAISSSHGTNLPAQGEYRGKPNNKDIPLFFMVDYISFDKILAERQTGRTFYIDLDNGASSIIKAMSNTKNFSSDVEVITVDNLDARLITMKYDRQGYPALQKCVFLAKGEELWQIRFICVDNSEKDSRKLIKLIDKMIQSIKFTDNSYVR